MVDITQSILNGFATGIGAGMANYLIIRRLETIERGIQAKINELNILNGKKKVEGQKNDNPKEGLSKMGLGEINI